MEGLQRIRVFTNESGSDEELYTLDELWLLEDRSPSFFVVLGRSGADGTVRILSLDRTFKFYVEG